MTQCVQIEADVKPILAGSMLSRLTRPVECNIRHQYASEPTILNPTQSRTPP